MSTPTGVPDDDEYWRHPDERAEPYRPATSTPAGPAAPPYTGPPPTEPPPPAWRPPIVAEPPAPREMPAQDAEALDEAEGSARTVTYGVALVAGAIALLLMCLLCARALF